MVLPVDADAGYVFTTGFLPVHSPVSAFVCPFAVGVVLGVCGWAEVAGSVIEPVPVNVVSD